MCGLLFLYLIFFCLAIFRMYVNTKTLHSCRAFFFVPQFLCNFFFVDSVNWNLDGDLLCIIC